MTVQGTVMELNSTVMEELFCIGREALSNSFHHAQATRIDVMIEYATNTLVVTSSDDGVGMDATTLAVFSKTGHWGLVGMKERASRIGAQLRCNCAPAFGTKLTVLEPASRASKKLFGLRQWLPAWCRSLN